LVVINGVAVEKLAHSELQKLDRIRKLYNSWTFSIIRFSTFFRKTNFFNSHRIYQHLFPC